MDSVEQSKFGKTTAKTGCHPENEDTQKIAHVSNQKNGTCLGLKLSANDPGITWCSGKLWDPNDLNLPKQMI
jgi:hypothetical protein